MTPQETDSDLPVSVQESLVEVWVGYGLLQGCVPFLLFDQRPNYGGGNEENGDLLQKVPWMHCHSQCPQPCSRP